MDFDFHSGRGQEGESTPEPEGIDIPETEKNNLSDIREDLQNPIKRRHALIRLGEWVKDCVLLMGGDPFTAFDVAAVFVQGIEKSYERRDSERRLREARAGKRRSQ